LLETPPLLDRRHYGHFDTASGNDLRSILQASIEKFAEARFGILH
jgi:hypothetical protein